MWSGITCNASGSHIFSWHFSNRKAFTSDLNGSTSIFALVFGIHTKWHVVELFKDRAEKIDCKEHFSPKEFDITIEKISKVRRTRNAAYNINFHFVWIPKTRAKILVEPFKSDVKAFLLEKCQEKIWDPLALQIMPDHIHFFLSAPPKWAPSKIVQELKTYSSRLLRRKYSIIREMR